jgi:predicted nucleic acid-binding protein
MLALDNEYSAVIDTCALVPISLCNLLLRLAEHPSFFAPRWSPDILAELKHVLQKRRALSEEKALKRIGYMCSAFPEANVVGYEGLIRSMRNHEKDRHVLAAAVKCKADAIITFNVKDFPSDSVEDYEIQVLTPDEFLVHQFHLGRLLVVRKVTDHILPLSLKHPLRPLSVLVPRFCELLRTELPNI